MHTALLLLRHNALMQDNNLLFGKESPYQDPPGMSSDYYDDLDSGERWAEARQAYCKGKQDILNPIIFFQDKTHLALKSKMTIEPICYTFGFFKRSIRNLSKAWMPLGYIPNIDQLAPNAKVEEKASDYQFIMKFFLSELVQFQKAGGINFLFSYRGSDFQCTMKIPVHYHIGDSEGQDKLLGKKLDFHNCRACNAGLEDFDNPTFQFTYTKYSKVMELRRAGTRAALDALDEMGFKRLGSHAVDDLEYSDTSYGATRSTPGDHLHTNQMGQEKRGLESSFGVKIKVQKVVKPRKRRKFNNSSSGMRETEEEEDMVVELSDREEEEEKSGDRRHGVFSKEVLSRVDNLAKSLSRVLRWQSDQNLPRMCFPHGITKLSYMQAHEFSGVTLLLFLILIIDHNYSYSNRRSFAKHEPGYIQFKMGQDKCNDIVRGLELLLLWGAFCSASRIPKNSLKIARKFVAPFTEQFKRSFVRTAGNGNKTLKLHLLRHFCDNIQWFGSIKNVDSSAGERSHIDNAKLPAENTQKHHKTLLQQVGKQFLINYKLDKFTSYIKKEVIMLKDNTDEGEFDLEEEHEDPPDNTGGGKGDIEYSKGHLICIYSDVVQHRRRKKQKDLPTGPVLEPWSRNSPLAAHEVCAMVREHILPVLPRPEMGVRVLTKTKRKGQVFHADPCYGSGRASKQHWAHVNYEGHGEVPCHLLCFLEIPDKPVTPIILPNNGGSIAEAGVHALIHTLAAPLNNSEDEIDIDTVSDLAHQDQQLVFRAQKWDSSIHHQEWNEVLHEAMPNKEIKPTLCVVDCEALSTPITAFPDPYASKDRHIYFFLRPHCQWLDVFMDYAKGKYGT
jgi:hypothetical protein